MVKGHTHDFTTGAAVKFYVSSLLRVEPSHRTHFWRKFNYIWNFIWQNLTATCDYCSTLQERWLKDTNRKNIQEITNCLLRKYRAGLRKSDVKLIMTSQQLKLSLYSPWLKASNKITSCAMWGFRILLHNCLRVSYGFRVHLFWFDLVNCKAFPRSGETASDTRRGFANSQTVQYSGDQLRHSHTYNKTNQSSCKKTYFVLLQCDCANPCDKIKLPYKFVAPRFVRI